MRRTLLLFATTVALAVPASASAAVQLSRDAAAVTGAMAAPGTSVAGAAFTLYPNTDPALGTPTAVVDSPLSDFPIDGPTFAVLSAGDVRHAAPGGTGPTNLNASQAAIRGNAYDVTTLRIDLDVPAGVNCLTLGFRFFTDESPGAPFNDGFIAELNTSNWTVNPSDNSIQAPNNFVFDQDGNPLSVNSPGQASLSQTEAQGTGYQYGTQRLNSARSISPGRQSLYLSVFDVGDEIVDTAAFIDRLSFLATEPGGCVAGATADETPPAVTLGVTGASADDTTPTLSGAAGDSPGDSIDVNARVYSGSSATGTAIQTLTATRSATSWAVDAAPLAPGTYTAQADQADIAGNTGVSAPATFTVAAPAPPPQQQVAAGQAQSPTPELGESVVAGAVSGTVRIKLKNGKFRVLGANEEIPLGSTVDATKGKVRLTSASNAAGATQSALFYQGAFVVTQTSGSKPITQLALNGALARCPKKGSASSSARRKKVRRLWGDGSGRFRTRGKHGAATVRGTKWLTEDRCGGTLFRVKRGSVSVRDFAKRKTVVLKKGKTYVARPKEPKKKG